LSKQVGSGCPCKSKFEIPAHESRLTFLACAVVIIAKSLCCTAVFLSLVLEHHVGQHQNDKESPLGQKDQAIPDDLVMPVGTALAKGEHCGIPFQKAENLLLSDPEPSEKHGSGEKKSDSQSGGDPVPTSNARSLTPRQKHLVTTQRE